MNKKHIIPLIAAGAAAFAACTWATGRCIDLTAWVLVHLGTDVGHAQAQAPLYTGLLLSFAAAGALWLWTGREEARRARARQRRRSRCGRVEGYSARRKTRESQERGA